MFSGEYMRNFFDDEDGADRFNPKYPGDLGEWQAAAVHLLNIGLNIWPGDGAALHDAVFHEHTPLSRLPNGSLLRFLPVRSSDGFVVLFETVGPEAGRLPDYDIKVPLAFFCRPRFRLHDYVVREFCKAFGLTHEQAQLMAEPYSTGETVGELVAEVVAHALNWAIVRFPAEAARPDGLPRIFAFRRDESAKVVIICDALLGASWELGMAEIGDGIDIWRWYLYKRARFIKNGPDYSPYLGRLPRLWSTPSRRFTREQAVDVWALAADGEGDFPGAWFEAMAPVPVDDDLPALVAFETDSDMDVDSSSSDDSDVEMPPPKKAPQRRAPAKKKVVDSDDDDDSDVEVLPASNGKGKAKAAPKRKS